MHTETIKLLEDYYGLMESLQGEGQDWMEQMQEVSRTLAALRAPPPPIVLNISDLQLGILTAAPGTTIIVQDFDHGAEVEREGNQHVYPGFKRDEHNDPYIETVEVKP